MVLRTIVCEPERLFADLLATALADAGAEVVAVTTEEDDLQAVLDGTAQRVVLGLGLGTDVLARVRATSAAFPSLRVVATHPQPPEELVRRARAAGADAVVDLRTSLEELVACVVAPDAHLTGRLAELELVGSPPGRREPHDVDGGLLLSRFLTPREQQTLRLLAGGASTRDMVTTLGVSTATARGYVQSVLSKLGVHTRLQAAAYAGRHGLLEQDTDPAEVSLTARLSS